MRKKSTLRAVLMSSNCCVSMDGLLKRRWRVRSDTPMRSISHWLVWPWRRSSSRIRLPICICILLLFFRRQYACLPRWLPNPLNHSDDHKQKRRRAISSPACGRRKYLLWIDKMLACRRAFAFVSHKSKPKWSFLRFKLVGTIANAILLYQFCIL